MAKIYASSSKVQNAKDMLFESLCASISENLTSSNSTYSMYPEESQYRDQIYYAVDDFIEDNFESWNYSSVELLAEAVYEFINANWR